VTEDHRFEKQMHNPLLDPGLGNVQGVIKRYEAKKTYRKVGQLLLPFECQNQDGSTVIVMDSFK
jgi:hypothetical protein